MFVISICKKKNLWTCKESLVSIEFIPGDVFIEVVLLQVVVAGAVHDVVHHLVEVVLLRLEVGLAHVDVIPAGQKKNYIKCQHQQLSLGS